MFRMIVSLVIIIVILSVVLGTPLIDENNEFNKESFKKITLILTNTAAATLKIISDILYKVVEVLVNDNHI